MLKPKLKLPNLQGELSAHNSGVIAVGSGDDVQIAGASGSGEAFVAVTMRR